MKPPSAQLGPQYILIWKRASSASTVDQDLDSILRNPAETPEQQPGILAIAFGTATQK
jgi:hypothetical protein